MKLKEARMCKWALENKSTGRLKIENVLRRVEESDGCLGM
jgi:hypothetical protein